MDHLVDTLRVTMASRGGTIPPAMPHVFQPRDRWNSLCVCGLSIAAHDDPPDLGPDAERFSAERRLIPASWVRHINAAIDRHETSVQRLFDHQIAHQNLNERIRVQQQKERAWPSPASPFSRP